MASKRKRVRSRKAAARPQEAQRSGFDMKRYGLLVGVIVLVLAVVSVLVIFDQGGRRSSQANPQLSEEISLDKSKGSPDAPVVVVEYGDFQ